MLLFLVMWCVCSFLVLVFIILGAFVMEWRQEKRKEKQEAEEHRQWQARMRRYPVEYERPIIEYDGDGLGGWSS